MRQPADVVEVERVGGVLGAADIGAGPVRCLLEVEERVGVRRPGRKATTRHREIQLCGAQLQVASPFRLGIEAEWHVGDQVAAGRRVGQIEDVLPRQEAAVGEGRIAGLVDLEAHRKRRGIPARQVGAHQRAGGARPEDRAVADVPIQRIRSAKGVVRLGQAPEVVVADGLGIARADADLVVQRGGAVVPGAQQPIGPELGLRREVRCT